jgi:dCMP deaminase
MSELLTETILKAHDRRQLKDKVFLHIARCIGELGTCDRKRVGAVFTRAGRCVAWGFNGAPPGLPHCSENDHGWGHDGAAHIYGCRNATHAEANAIAFAAREDCSIEGTVLYVSVAPCDVCARLLIAAGVVRVVAYEAYRDTSGVELLKGAGVSVSISA